MKASFVVFCLSLASAPAFADETPGRDVAYESVRCGMTDAREGHAPAFVVEVDGKAAFKLRASHGAGSEKAHQLFRQCRLALASARLGHPDHFVRVNDKDGTVATSDGRVIFDAAKVHCIEAGIWFDYHAVVLIDDDDRIVFKPRPVFAASLGAQPANGYDKRFDAEAIALDGAAKACAAALAKSGNFVLDVNAESLSATGAITPVAPR